MPACRIRRLRQGRSFGWPQVEPAAKGCRAADVEAGCAGADIRYQRAVGSERKIAEDAEAIAAIERPGNGLRT